MKEARDTLECNLANAYSMGVSEVAGRSLAIDINKVNVTNRQFKKHCLAYEQNA